MTRQEKIAELENRLKFMLSEECDDPCEYEIETLKMALEVIRELEVEIKVFKQAADRKLKRLQDLELTQTITFIPQGSITQKSFGRI